MFAPAKGSICVRACSKVIVSSYRYRLKYTQRTQTNVYIIISLLTRIHRKHIYIYMYTHKGRNLLLINHLTQNMGESGVISVLAVVARHRATQFQ